MLTDREKANLIVALLIWRRTYAPTGGSNPIAAWFKVWTPQIPELKHLENHLPLSREEIDELAFKLSDGKIDPRAKTVEKVPPPGAYDSSRATVATTESQPRFPLWWKDGRLYPQTEVQTEGEGP